MTRSSTKELIEPYNEPERVLQSLRKLFKTTSFDHSSSPKFELFSDYAEHVKEEIAKTMTEPYMEEYMTKTQEDYGSGIARPKFDKDAKFELKGQFLKELRDKTFSGSEMRMQMSTLKEFLRFKYCPPSRTAKRMEEINNFQQEPDETLYQAWERFKELLLRSPQHYLTNMQEADDAKKAIQEMADYSQKWHNGASTKNKSNNTSDGLAAIQAQLNNLGTKIKKEEGKTSEEAYYTQFGVPFLNAGRYRVAAPGIYQRDNGNPSYQERRQTMKESLSKFMAESSKRHDENSSLIKEYQASTDAAIKNQGASIKALEIQIRQMNKSIKFSRASIPFLGRLKEYDEKEMLKGLKKLQVNSTEFATSLKRLIKEKTRIKEEIKAIMNEHYSVIIKDGLPLIEKGPGSFSLPCKISDMCFDEALANLGASVSVMPYSTFTKLGLGKLASTKLTIELADKTIKHPKGIAENVLVGIDKFAFPVDFIVLDMPEDIKIPLILRRPFLSTAHD
ncbi:hypothetical protein Tco_1016194 [Tanacetum coccineum]|uniref:Retrotransposon gag domain-containing protein n=1 Tax=Tanacetum coccineum TaxID=301880 RepID=A0ABQ5FNZ8_9ASTR